MKLYKYIAILCIFFTSCNATKNATAGSKTKLISAKKVLKKHKALTFDKKTIDAKLKMNFKNEKQTVGFSVKMKIKKDEVIWLKGTKIITVFKAKITPEKVSFYSPYYKNYIEGDFKTLQNVLGTSVNFQQLQNMLLGQAMFDTSQKHTVQLDDQQYILTPKKQLNLFDVFYWINPSHFKLDKQAVVNKSNGQRLDIVYPSYKEINSTLFPEKIQIIGKAKNKNSNIDISVKSITFDQEISTPFSIPSGYKEIKF